MGMLKGGEGWALRYDRHTRPNNECAGAYEYDFRIMYEPLLAGSSLHHVGRPRMCPVHGDNGDDKHPSIGCIPYTTDTANTRCAKIAETTGLPKGPPAVVVSVIPVKKQTGPGYLLHGLVVRSSYVVTNCAKMTGINSGGDRLWHTMQSTRARYRLTLQGS
ncbi:hypothetical protein BJ508DRAFT_312376 [Ascobolus immersus RN42]|uniref:Uncharacterized protein n=1 Tax=Ascobolus immersus RN42 TaxID=1160509 RepID=A0A3N4HMG4_ASCIM|nr:hypothetical protein BJ508DRAFT_312376 [Ascobolus immersus RN42]